MDTTKAGHKQHTVQEAYTVLRKEYDAVFVIGVRKEEAGGGHIVGWTGPQTPLDESLVQAVFEALKDQLK